MAPAAVAQALTLFVWADLHAWRAVGDDVLELEVGALRDPNVLRGDTADDAVVSVRVARRAAALHRPDQRLLAARRRQPRHRARRGARVAAHASSTRPADAAADLFFPPSARAAFDAASSRLELLHDAYQRCTVKRGVMPVERIVELIERHLSDGEPLTRLELLAADFAATGVARAARGDRGREQRDAVRHGARRADARQRAAARRRDAQRAARRRAGRAAHRHAAVRVPRDDARAHRRRVRLRARRRAPAGAVRRRPRPAAAPVDGGQRDRRRRRASSCCARCIGAEPRLAAAEPQPLQREGGARRRRRCWRRATTGCASTSPTTSSPTPAS
jgi:hypothetical protein